jgi:serine/threonine protein kinase
MIHRDLKPNNIAFLNKDTLQIKIIDFGLSTQFDKEDFKNRNCGTPGYMAPEILKNDDLASFTSAIDVFSAVIILFNLLTK